MFIILTAHFTYFKRLACQANIFNIFIFFLFLANIAFKRDRKLQRFNFLSILNFFEITTIIINFALIYSGHEYLCNIWQ